MKNNTRKQDILEAYASIVVSQGLEGASIGAVARYMGINQSLIFHYFENKDDLLCQMSEMVVEKCIRFYEKTWPASRGVTPAAFEEYVETILEIHRRRSRRVSPKLYFSLVYLLPRNKTVQSSFVRLTDAAATMIAERLEACRQAGFIETEDSHMAARTLMCLADGILCYDGLVPAAERPLFVERQKQLFFSSVHYVPRPAEPSDGAQGRESARTPVPAVKNAAQAASPAAGGRCPKTE